MQVSKIYFVKDHLVGWGQIRFSVIYCWEQSQLHNFKDNYLGFVF
jgi:hypothetical protein